MATETLKRALQVAGAAVGLLLWLGAMLLLGRATQGADEFAELYNWLFLVNAATHAIEDSVEVESPSGIFGAWRAFRIGL